MIRLLRNSGSKAATLGLAGLLALGMASCGAQENSEPAADAGSAWVPQSAADSLLARSIGFHDPNGHYGSRTIALVWSGTNPQGVERMRFEISLAPNLNDFSLEGHYGGTLFEYAVEGDQFRATIDGEVHLDEEARDKLVLGRENGMFWRNYFGFLAGLPMNLRNPEVQRDPTPQPTEFMGRTVHAVGVTYDDSIGTDTWHFYFLPETAELVGCRFTKADPENPGEYLVFEDLVEADGLRLPQRRRWFVNETDRHLGDDLIERVTVEG